MMSDATEILRRASQSKPSSKGGLWRRARGAFLALAVSTVGMGASACQEAQEVHTLKLKVTQPDGQERSFKVRGPANWDYDSLGKAFAGWPLIADWTVETEAGVTAQMLTYQPGTYESVNASLILDGQIHTTVVGGVRMHVDRVHFTGDAAFPFEFRGSLDGSIDGYSFEGDWTISSDNCTDTLVRGAGCGSNFTGEDYPEQTWEVDGWETYGTCPGSIVSRFVDGNTMVINEEEASIGAAEPLQCVITYPNAYTAICGADDPNVEADGCTWSVTAVAWPGNAYLGSSPLFAVLAGTVGDGCEPLVCTYLPVSYTHISGAYL